MDEWKPCEWHTWVVEAPSGRAVCKKCGTMLDRKEVAERLNEVERLKDVAEAAREALANIDLEFVHWKERLLAIEFAYGSLYKQIETKRGRGVGFRTACYGFADCWELAHVLFAKLEEIRDTLVL